jgi:hypothetical protein
MVPRRHPHRKPRTNRERIQAPTKGEIVWIVIVVCIVVMAALAAQIVFAHAHDADGNTNWIESGNYKSQNGNKCCGPTDCERLKPEDTEPRTDGVWLPRFHELVPYSEATPSEDQFNWRCANKNLTMGGPQGHRTCFFFKYGAS